MTDKEVEAELVSLESKETDELFFFNTSLSQDEDKELFDVFFLFVSNERSWKWEKSS
jgi:hypothetical protein